MSEPVIMTIDSARLSAILQGMGFRAEPFEDNNGSPCIRSATSGVAFTIRLGNRAQPPAEGYADFSYIAIVKIAEGPFSLERVNEWNLQRRFCRLHRRDDFLVLDLDVIVAGGVTESYVRGTLALWDRIVQDLVLFLRGQTMAEASQAS
ncbi:MAG TPA: YbjN domain-containing protein [Alphaproteobacteria bacterium]|nr:YbjN domain-containing protein [Alphaproteobacteria bacterium]